MEKLKDYEWMCNIYKIQRYVFSNISYKEISRRHLLEGFIGILIGTELLKSTQGIEI